MSATPPPVPPPGSVLPDFPLQPEAGKSGGCLKGGLIGCAVLSILLIVGLVFLGLKARKLMDWAMGVMGDRVLAAATAEVTPGQKADFQRALEPFAEGAKSGKVGPDRIRDFQTKATDALADGKVTPEELKGLQENLERAVK